MWRGSAAEYRHERENEVVCLDCGAKRKDACTTSDGAACHGHPTRAHYAEMEEAHRRAQDRVHELQRRLDEYRAQVREKWTAAEKDKP